MMRYRFLLGCAAAALTLSLSPAPAAEPAPAKTRVLVVTGGHEFEEPQLWQMFKELPGISFEPVAHPHAHARLKKEAATAYDALVFYDMHQDISEPAKADLVARLKEGKGLVVLHHAIANYQNWPEYHRIIGARYYLEKTLVDGVEKPRSAWKHDMKFKVQTAPHPITRGVPTFDIHDETYKWFDVASDVTPLLMTDEPESNKVIGWAKTYAAARVVYIQLGHDHFAYENPSFRKLVAQAIGWVTENK